MEANSRTNEMTKRCGPPVLPKPKIKKSTLPQNENEKMLTPDILMNGQRRKESEMFIDQTQLLPSENVIATTKKFKLLKKLEGPVWTKPRGQTTKQQQKMYNESLSVSPTTSTRLKEVENCVRFVTSPAASYEHKEKKGGVGPPVAPKPKTVNFKLSLEQEGGMSTNKSRDNKPISKESDTVMYLIDKAPETPSQSHLPKEVVSEGKSPSITTKSASLSTNNDCKKVRDNYSFGNGVDSPQVQPRKIEQNTQKEGPTVYINSTSVSTNSEPAISNVSQTTTPSAFNQRMDKIVRVKPPVAPKPKAANSKLSERQDEETSSHINANSKEHEILKDDIIQMSKISSHEPPPIEDVLENIFSQTPPITTNSAPLPMNNDSKKVEDGSLENGVTSSTVVPTEIKTNTENEGQTEGHVNSTSPDRDRSEVHQAESPTTVSNQENDETLHKETEDQQNKTAVAGTKKVPRFNSRQRKIRNFQERYVYCMTALIEEEPKEVEMNVVIIGLHEKSGGQMFQKLFPNDVREENLSTMRTHRKPFKEGKVIYMPGEVAVTVFASPPQYAVYSLSSFVRKVRQRFKNLVRCFIVVFDANFVRFSSDVKQALAHLETKYYGPTFWNNAALVILNSDDVIGEGTIHSYLNRQGNENLKEYADKMNGRVIALPTYQDDYDLAFQMIEFMKIIFSLQNDYKSSVQNSLWSKVRRLFCGGL